ncbi:MAG: hypothetical protein HDT43_01170 [Ruminococcaceae bacterium]|nr:hypothetical protein [Oscillospiraceae bacterium]
MKTKRMIPIISALLLLSACSGGQESSSSEPPVYNNAQYSTMSDPREHEGAGTPESPSVSQESTESVSDNSTADVPSTIEPPEFSAVSVKQIARGNTFEENASFGHFCAVDNGYYFVDLNNGFLYFTDKSGNTKTVLEDYVRALNYYDGYLYYIKGTKKEFLSDETFYAGSIWRLDPVSGEEVLLIEVPENLSLNVNEYGIFCDPKNGGGIALYDFDGNELRIISDINQDICIIGNAILLRKSDKTVLCDLDTGEETDFPSDLSFSACTGDKLVCFYMSDPWDKIVLDMSTGEAAVLPHCMTNQFTVLNGELYTVDTQNLYRVDFEKMTYESIISYPLGNAVYFLDLHSDGERLYTVMGNNQANAYRYAEVDIENGELKYPEGQ